MHCIHLAHTYHICGYCTVDVNICIYIYLYITFGYFWQLFLQLSMYGCIRSRISCHLVDLEFGTGVSSMAIFKPPDGIRPRKDWGEWPNRKVSALFSPGISPYWCRRLMGDQCRGLVHRSEFEWSHPRISMVHTKVMLNACNTCDNMYPICNWP